jgi:hypothetical protein
MARSSTSYRPKWKLGNTTVVRVPQTLAPAVLRYAHELDDKTAPDERRQSKQMNTNSIEKLAELRAFQAKADAIREELGFNATGKVIYFASLNVCPDDTVVVEADGFGGATTSVVEGNYPVDYVTKFERFFPSESEAENAAEELACHRASPHQVLAVPA